MPERKTSRKLSAANTKQEMLEAYSDLLKQLEEKREADAPPEQKIAEKAARQVVATADSLSAEAIISGISGLKAEMGKMLTTLSDKLEQEVGRYDAVKRAIAEKERELAEIYEIQKAASSLAALIEAQNLKKLEFEADMATRKEALSREIEEMRAECTESSGLPNKRSRMPSRRAKGREKEEYEYALTGSGKPHGMPFEKEKAGFEAENVRLEREIALRREQADRDFADREQALARQEQELADLRTRVGAFPKELEITVAREVKTAVEKVQTDAKFRLELVQKELEGERNVLQARIASLEALVKDQSVQLAKMNEQVEKSYTQVQAIAVKAVEGTAAKVTSVVQPQQRQGE
jgi:hypothetical protein